jgi:hypothetical protein
VEVYIGPLVMDRFNGISTLVTLLPLIGTVLYNLLEPGSKYSSPTLAAFGAVFETSTLI